MTQAITQPIDTLPIAKWSVDEYHRMIAAGLLRDRRVELLNGVIVEMTPIEPIHDDTEEELVAYLRPLLEGRAKVREAKAVTLPDDSEPIPDISVVKSGRYRDRHPHPDDIYLLIEIANSQPARDLQAKRLTYARSGIVEYWVFNLQTQEMKVFREIEGEGESADYRVNETWELDVISLQAFPDIVLSADTMKRLANEP